MIGALVNACLLYAVHLWPGWEAVPFLTEDMTEVLGVVSATIVVGIAANLVYAISDPVWVRSLGDLVTTSVGLAAAIQLWQVFPFDFSAYSFDWALVTRTVLVVAIVGSAIGILVAAGRLVRFAVVHEVENGHRLRH
jgi:hypothetical protein